MPIKHDRVRCRVLAFDGDGGCKRIISLSKRRFINKLQAIPAVDFVKYELRVKYLDTNTRNSGTYDTKKALLQAYKAFTSKEDVDYINNYWS